MKEGGVCSWTCKEWIVRQYCHITERTPCGGTKNSTLDHLVLRLFKRLRTFRDARIEIVSILIRGQIRNLLHIFSTTQPCCSCQRVVVQGLMRSSKPFFGGSTYPMRKNRLKGIAEDQNPILRLVPLIV